MLLASSDLTMICLLNNTSSARPEYASSTFVLLTTFPNKELSDESQTLADAKLLNAVIVQRLK
jgi:UBX domain-containing protein 1